MIRVVFDIDNTLAKIVVQDGILCQIPDYELIQVLKWFLKNGDEVYAWSGGGVEYAENWLKKLGLYDKVKAIPKVDYGATHSNMDIAFDDVEINLAKQTILVKRELQGPKRT